MWILLGVASYHGCGELPGDARSGRWRGPQPGVDDRDGRLVAAAAASDPPAARVNRTTSAGMHVMNVQAVIRVRRNGSRDRWHGTTGNLVTAAAAPKDGGKRCPGLQDYPELPP